jgi:hypothetical protein
MMRDFVQTAFAGKHERVAEQFSCLPGYHLTTPVIYFHGKAKACELNVSEKEHMFQFCTQNNVSWELDRVNITKHESAHINGIQVRTASSDRYVKTRDSVICARYLTEEDDQERYDLQFS